MTSPTPPAGWYPDPSGGPGQRWWDGQGWTANTQPSAPAPGPATSPAPFAQQVADPTGAFGVPTGGYGGAPVPPQYGGGYQGGYPGGGFRPSGMGGQAGLGRHRYSFYTFGIVAACLVLAFATHFVIFGFLPIGTAMQARRANEPLAVVALIAAIAALVISIALIAH